jgi:protein LTV1
LNHRFYKDLKKKLAKNVHQGNEWSNDDDDDDDDDDDVDDSDNDSDNKSDSDSDTYKGSNGNDFFENQSLNEFETKSRFTDYSMTSSIIRRNDKLQHLDKHFESIYSQYDEDQIGALDVEDIDGYRDLNNLVLQKALEEMDILTTKVQYKTEKYANNMRRIDENDDVDSDDDDEDEYEYIYVKDEHDDDRLDCESILDTYSTTNNLPHVIRDDDGLVHRPRIRISKKTGVPIVDSQQKSLKKTLKDMQKNEVVLIVRKANETKEEKKQRKQAVKEQRRERRSEKKLNKLAFKEEKKIQMKNIKNLKEFSNTVKLS